MTNPKSDKEYKPNPVADTTTTTTTTKGKEDHNAVTTDGKSQESNESSEIVVEKLIKDIETETKKKREKIYELISRDESKRSKYPKFIHSALNNPIVSLMLGGDTKFLEKMLTKALENLKIIFDSDEHAQKQYSNFSDLPSLLFGILYQMTDAVNAKYSQTGHKIDVKWNTTRFHPGCRDISVMYCVDEYIEGGGESKPRWMTVVISELKIHCDNLESFMGFYVPSNKKDFRRIISKDKDGELRQEDIQTADSLYKQSSDVQDLERIFVKRNRFRRLEFLKEFMNEALRLLLIQQQQQQDGVFTDSTSEMMMMMMTNNNNKPNNIFHEEAFKRSMVIASLFTNFSLSCQ